MALLIREVEPSIIALLISSEVQIFCLLTVNSRITQEAVGPGPSIKVMNE